MAGTRGKPRSAPVARSAAHPTHGSVTAIAAPRRCRSGVRIPDTVASPGPPDAAGAGFRGRGARSWETGPVVCGPERR